MSAEGNAVRLAPDPTSPFRKVDRFGFLYEVLPAYTNSKKIGGQVSK
jgi:hypothetical protein